MEEQVQECKTAECAHFIGKDSIGLYRGKFVWTMVIASVLVVLLFVILAVFYNKSLQEVVELHKSSSESIISSLQPAVISYDSCVYVNEQLSISMQEHIQTTEALLQLQSQKIQSDFTLLSVWAGILMIVFLVFSIYSMYKTDELIKQGKEGVKNIEKAKEIVRSHVLEIDEHVAKELEGISETVKAKNAEITKDALDSIEQIKQQAEEEKNMFKKMLNEKTTEFQEIYTKYTKKLEETAESYRTLTVNIVETLRAWQMVKKDVRYQKEKGGE